MEQLTKSQISFRTLISRIRRDEGQSKSVIGAAIFRLTMNNLGEPVTEAEVHSMILEADLDGDGKINFSEFKMLMATKLNDV